MNLPDLILFLILAGSVGFTIGGLLVFFIIRNRISNTSTTQKVSSERTSAKFSLIAGLYRRKEDGVLTLHHSGKRSITPSDFTEAELMEQSKLAREWLDWIRKAPTLSLAPSLPASPMSAAASDTDNNRLSAVSLKPPSNPHIPTKPQSLESTLDALIPEHPTSANIVGQIDNILQKRLNGSNLESLNIKLREDQQGGILIWIGPDRYTAIEDIPGADIRTQILAAVREWEELPGRTSASAIL